MYRFLAVLLLLVAVGSAQAGGVVVRRGAFGRTVVVNRGFNGNFNRGFNNGFNRGFVSPGFQSRGVFINPGFSYGSNVGGFNGTRGLVIVGFDQFGNPIFR